MNRKPNSRLKRINCKSKTHTKTKKKINNLQIFLGVIRDDKDKFKCLYLLVETAVAVRQREKEQDDDDDVHVLGN